MSMTLILLLLGACPGTQRKVHFKVEVRSQVNAPSGDALLCSFVPVRTLEDYGQNVGK